MKKYAVEYIQQALSGDTLDAPDRAKSGAYIELLNLIYDNSQMWSTKSDKALSAQTALSTFDELKPGLVEGLMPSHRLPPGVKTLAHGSGWTVIHSKDLKKLPPVNWLLVDKLVQKGLTVIYGASGAGKSFHALELALLVAQDSPVIYMAGEDELGYEQRVTAWEVHTGKDRENLYVSLGSVPVLESGEVKEFIESLKDLNPALVVVDTLARAMVGGDENSSRDMGLFIRACNEIQRKLECAVLLIHHTNKLGDAERGSGALRAGSDVMIKISALDDEITVECSKTKNSKPFETEYMRFIEVPGTDSGVLIKSDKVTSRDGIHRLKDLTQSQVKVLRAIHELQDSESTKSGDIADFTRLPRESVLRVCKRLKEYGLISQENKGGAYILSAHGETLFTEQ